MAIVTDPAAVGEFCSICMARTLGRGMSYEEASAIALISEKEPGVPDEDGDGYRHVDCFRSAPVKGVTS